MEQSDSLLVAARDAFTLSLQITAGIAAVLAVLIAIVAWRMLVSVPPIASS